MSLHIALILTLAISLTGCGKKATETKLTAPNFDHPSPQVLQDISHKQGWQIENVQARARAFDALESGRQPAESDWELLVKAADAEKGGFDISLAMVFSRHITGEYRPVVLTWCERNMEQTQDPDAAVIAYDCYVRAGGSDREAWATKLKARGQFYVDGIAECDRRAAVRM